MASDYKDYYKILEIPKDSDEKAIKAAYRKLARKYHPDVNPNDATAEDKFKEIGEAYEILSDKDKRQKYDQYGDQWKAYSQGGGFGGADPGAAYSGGSAGYGGGAAGFGGLDDLFSSLFGDAARQGAQPGFGGGFRPSNRPRTQSHRQNVDLSVEISLEEAYHGTTRSFNLGLPETCQRCGGRGAISSPGGRKCPTCDGTGKARGSRGLFAPECPQCGGSGEAVEVCHECKGAGTVERKKRLSDVKIPAGIRQDQRIRLAGQGSGGSDIYLKVSIRSDPRFERNNDDLLTDFVVPFTVAALGGHAAVETLEGRKVLSIPAGTQSGANFRLAGLGMPTLKGGARGNLYAKAKITVPKDLSAKEKELLYELAKLRKDEVKVGA